MYFVKYILFCSENILLMSKYLKIRNIVHDIILHFIIIGIWHLCIHKEKKWIRITRIIIRNIYYYYHYIVYCIARLSRKTETAKKKYETSSLLFLNNYYLNTFTFYLSFESQLWNIAYMYTHMYVIFFSTKLKKNIIAFTQKTNRNKKSSKTGNTHIDCIQFLLLTEAIKVYVDLPRMDSSDTGSPP